ncbi:MAG: hypothetical protein H7831_12890 [Magnetococcus sp. WYHC-3]
MQRRRQVAAADSNDAAMSRPDNSGSGWGCPHECAGQCLHVRGFACDPGMKGCVLAGRFKFSNPAKNRPAGPRKHRRDPSGPSRKSRGEGDAF